MSVLDYYRPNVPLEDILIYWNFGFKKTFRFQLCPVKPKGNNCLHKQLSG